MLKDNIFITPRYWEHLRSSMQKRRNLHLLFSFKSCFIFFFQVSSVFWVFSISLLLLSSLNFFCLTEKPILFLQIVRLLANHPYFDITLMTADRKAGQSIGSVFPHLVTQVYVFTVWWFLFCLYFYSHMFVPCGIFFSRQLKLLLNEGL